MTGELTPVEAERLGLEQVGWQMKGSPPEAFHPAPCDHSHPSAGWWPVYRVVDPSALHEGCIRTDREGLREKALAAVPIGLVVGESRPNAALIVDAVLAAISPPRDDEVTG
jgi:hypothetical protein